jgi:hypothetical protein
MSSAAADAMTMRAPWLAASILLIGCLHLWLAGAPGQKMSRSFLDTVLNFNVLELLQVELATLIWKVDRARHYCDNNQLRDDEFSRQRAMR